MQNALNPKERAELDRELGKIGYSDFGSCHEYFLELYTRIIESPPHNPNFAGLSPQQVFLRVVEKYDFLCFGIYKALTENRPELALNALYSYNRMEASHDLRSGFDHCIRLKKVLCCCAGNNYDIVDRLLPLHIGLSKKGEGFLVTATNLILSLRSGEYRDEALRQAGSFLSNRIADYEAAIVKALRCIATGEGNGFSEQLEFVTCVHRKMRWLHDFKNGIGRSFPYISFGLRSLAERYLPETARLAVVEPVSSLWWKEFSEMNQASSYRAGAPFMVFEGVLTFLNKIEDCFEELPGGE